VIFRLVFHKELLDHWRDRRSLLGSLVLPLLGPLLLIGIFQIVENLEKERPLDLPVVGAEHAPRLIADLVANGVHVLPGPPEPEEVVREGDADMVLVIDSSYAEHYRSAQLARVRLIVDDSRTESHKNVRRVERILLAYTQGLGALRLMARGVAPQTATPLGLEEIDLATPQKLAANLLSMLLTFQSGVELSPSASNAYTLSCSVAAYITLRVPDPGMFTLATYNADACMLPSRS